LKDWKGFIITTKQIKFKLFSCFIFINFLNFKKIKKEPTRSLETSEENKSQIIHMAVGHQVKNFFIQLVTDMVFDIQSFHFMVD